MSSPASSPVIHRKPRAVQSCLHCRSKKLKCDRQQPCGQCLKRNRVGTDRCVYDERAGSLGGFEESSRPFKIAKTLPSLQPAGAIDIHAIPNARGDLPIVQNGEPGQRHRVLQPADTIVQRDRDLARNQNNDSAKRYHGLSNTRSLVALFPDAVQFVNTIAETPEMKIELHALHRMFPKSPIESYESNSGVLASMAALLPAWDICDQLLEIYCLYFESIQRVLHLPTLLSEYQLFRDADMDDSGRERFLPQLILIIAIASKMWKFGTTSQVVPIIDPQEACRLVEHWLSSLGNKERAHLRTLQTYTLLVLVKQTIPTSPALLWQSTGDLIRLALMSGLHRDPEELSGRQAVVSVVELQSRRWLWYTIAELDIKASIACCLPSLVGTIDYTCQVPKRIADDSMTSEYNRQRIEHFGSISTAHTTLQIDLSRSLPLRIKALQLLTRVHPNIDEINEILQQLDEERLRLTLHPALRHSTEHETLFTTIMLDMCFRRPIISLYTLQLQRLREDEDARIHDTCRAFVSAAVGIMSHSDMLDPRLTDHESIKHNRYWIVFQAIYGDDLIRAATGACFSLKVLDSATPNSAAQSNPGRSERNWTIWPRNAVRRMVEEVMESMIRLTPDLRTTLKQIMVLALAAELTRVHLDTESKGRQMKDALQRILKLCRERFDAESGNNATGYNDLEHFGSTTTPDFEELLNSQLLDVDPFGFDWGVNPQPIMNF